MLSKVELFHNKYGALFAQFDHFFTGSTIFGGKYFTGDLDVCVCNDKCRGTIERLGMVCKKMGLVCAWTQEYAHGNTLLRYISPGDCICDLQLDIFLVTPERYMEIKFATICLQGMLSAGNAELLTDKAYRVEQFERLCDASRSLPYRI